MDKNTVGLNPTRFTGAWTKTHCWFESYSLYRSLDKHTVGLRPTRFTGALTKTHCWFESYLTGQSFIVSHHWKTFFEADEAKCFKFTNVFKNNVSNVNNVRARQNEVHRSQMTRRRKESGQADSIGEQEQEKEADAERHDNLTGDSTCSDSVNGASIANRASPEGIHHTEPAVQYFAQV